MEGVVAECRIESRRRLRHQLVVAPRRGPEIVDGLDHPPVPRIGHPRRKRSSLPAALPAQVLVDAGRGQVEVAVCRRDGIPTISPIRTAVGTIAARPATMKTTAATALRRRARSAV